MREISIYSNCNVCLYSYSIGKKKSVAIINVLKIKNIIFKASGFYKIDVWITKLIADIFTLNASKD